MISRGGVRRLKNPFGPRRLGNRQRGSDVFVESLDEMSSECARFLFVILVDEEIKLLQSRLFLLGDALDPIIEPRSIRLGLDGPDPADEGGRGGQTHR